MNDIVAWARVLRLLREGLFQNLARLELILVSLVQTVGGGEQRQRVEDPRLAVIGIALRDLLHLAHIGSCAHAMIELVMIRVERRERLEIISFARSLRLECESPRNGIASLLQVGRRRRRPNLVPDAHGDPPVRHGAIRFGLGDRGKFLQGLPVPERMQRRERGIEARLHVGAAGDGEADVASAAFHQIVADGLGARAARRAERKKCGKNRNEPASSLGRRPNPRVDDHGSTPMVASLHHRSVRALRNRAIAAAIFSPRFPG
jgi:hypothetical protein